MFNTPKLDHPTFSLQHHKIFPIYKPLLFHFEHTGLATLPLASSPTPPAPHGKHTRTATTVLGGTSVPWRHAMSNTPYSFKYSNMRCVMMI